MVKLSDLGTSTTVEKITTSSISSIKKSNPNQLGPSRLGETNPYQGQQTSNYMMESYAQADPQGRVNTSTYQNTKVYVAEEEVDIPATDAKGKYKAGSYNDGYYTKSYHPKTYSEEYKNNVFSPNKAVPLTELEKEKERKSNKLSFLEMLGCAGL